MTRAILALLLISILFITGCECTAGFGRDLQKAGSWIERNSSR
jgi:predicted small secreted protein